MIFVTDKGRLCNNIIHYGHLYAWGREHGLKTMSMRFAYKYRDFHICHTRYHNFLTYVVAKYAARWGLIPTVVFDNPYDFCSDYTEQKRTMQTRRFVVATGWCVRFYDLFDKYKAEIQALFAFSEKVEARVARRLASAGNDTIRLGVHIRRGDYATWCGGHYYYHDQQYADVIARFLQLVPDKKVEIYICGNDPQLQRDYYVSRFGSERVHFPDGSASEDLCLLSHCDYLIGPPSTFTLVASMYHDAPLYWITDANSPLQLADFQTFDRCSRRFDSLYRL